MLVLKICIQHRLRRDLPVGRACAHRPPSVRIVHVGLNALAHKRHARAHLLARAKEMPQVNIGQRAATMIRRQIHRLNCCRLLGNKVNHSARGCNPALHAVNAVQDLHPLLVFERNILLPGNGHAVDLKPGGEIDRESANLVIAVISHGRVILAH